MVEITENTLEFLSREDVQDALAANDMGAFYELVTRERGWVPTGAITMLLMRAGVDPLQGVTEIPKSFLYEQQDIKEFNIPEGIIKIGKRAFATTMLQNIYVPDSVEEIGEMAFYNIPLKQVRLPAGVVLMDYAFVDTDLESIELEDAKFSEGVSTFQGCKNLKSAIIKGNTTYLPWGLFESCSNLAHVELPTALKEIDSNVFRGCNSLRKINFAGTTEQWKQIEIGEYNIKLFSCKIICSGGILRFDKTLGAWAEI